MRKTIFINTHPIQYFAPLYRYLNENGVRTECWYCSDENVKGHLDRQFGARVEWNIPILNGYSFRFFRNYSWKPSLYNGFFGLINTGMVKTLLKEPRSLVIVHGWACLTHVLVMIFARLAGHNVCLRGENPVNQELLKSALLRHAKRVVLQGILFRFVHYFLYIGNENKSFYKYYGVSEKRLVFTPYAVDNERFRHAANQLLPRKIELRAQLGFPADASIILFAAKFIEKKRPMDLIKAYELLDLPSKCLVMVGEGELRSQMEQYIREKNLSRTFVMGFINQLEIPNYYSIADVFVLCSGEGETWGLSVNEAMNFNLPVVISRTAGCAKDLAKKEADGGFLFDEGDVGQLKVKLESALQMRTSRTREVVNDFSYEAIAKAIRTLIERD